MAKKTVVTKVDIRTGSELKSECQRYLKDAIAEVLLDCQETLYLAQDELKKQKELVKKCNTDEKNIAKQLAAAKEALVKKSTKAIQNKVKTLTSKYKEATKSLTQLSKNITKLETEIVKIKAYQKKEKAFKAAFNEFERNYQASEAVAASAKAVVKKAPKAVSVKAKKVQVTNEPAPVEVKPIVDASLVPGQKAPAFSIKNDKGEQVSLSDFAGKKVVLYFYPKDDTPGCTAQAHDFTCHQDKFQQNNTVILGVSRDSEASHVKFKEKYNINYDLLADTDETVCQAYGVIKMKNLYGKEVRGIERSTFLIDENGVISRLWRKVKVADHVATVLAQTEEKEFALA